MAESNATTFLYQRLGLQEKGRPIYKKGLDLNRDGVVSLAPINEVLDKNDDKVVDEEEAWGFFYTNAPRLRSTRQIIEKLIGDLQKAEGGEREEAFERLNKLAGQHPNLRSLRNYKTLLQKNGIELERKQIKNEPKNKPIREDVEDFSQRFYNTNVEGALRLLPRFKKLFDSGGNSIKTNLIWVLRTPPGPYTIENPSKLPAYLSFLASQLLNQSPEVMLSIIDLFTYLIQKYHFLLTKKIANELFSLSINHRLFKVDQNFNLHWEIDRKLLAFWSQVKLDNEVVEMQFDYLKPRLLGKLVEYYSDLALNLRDLKEKGEKDKKFKEKLGFIDKEIEKILERKNEIIASPPIDFDQARDPLPLSFYLEFLNALSQANPIIRNDTQDLLMQVFLEKMRISNIFWRVNRFHETQTGSNATLKNIISSKEDMTSLIAILDGFLFLGVRDQSQAQQLLGYLLKTRGYLSDELLVNRKFDLVEAIFEKYPSLIVKYQNKILKLLEKIYQKDEEMPNFLKDEFRVKYLILMLGEKLFIQCPEISEELLLLLFNFFEDEMIHDKALEVILNLAQQKEIMAKAKNLNEIKKDDLKSLSKVFQLLAYVSQKSDYNSHLIEWSREAINSNSSSVKIGISLLLMQIAITDKKSRLAAMLQLAEQLRREKKIFSKNILLFLDQILKDELEVDDEFIKRILQDFIDQDEEFREGVLKTKYLCEYLLGAKFLIKQKIPELVVFFKEEGSLATLDFLSTLAFRYPDIFTKEERNRLTEEVDHLIKEREAKKELKPDEFEKLNLYYSRLTLAPSYKLLKEATKRKGGKVR